MNRVLDDDKIISLTKQERIFPRKLVFTNRLKVKYDDKLRNYRSHIINLPLKPTLVDDDDELEQTRAEMG